jgi:hypothetical protein
MVMRQDYAGGEPLNIARVAAALVGVVYLIVGLVGFAVTGFDNWVALNTKADLFGFDLNVFHNIVHSVIGLGLLIGSRARDVAVPQGMLIGGGIVYLAAALLGFLNDLQILSINDGLAADNFLHLASGIAAIILGLAGARQSANAAPYRGVPMGEGPRPIEERRGMWERPHEV